MPVLLGRRFYLFAYHTAQGFFQLFLVYGLLECFVDEGLVSTAPGLSLEKGDDPGVEHDVDPLLAGRILKVNAEPGAVDIRLDDFRIFIKPIRYFQSRFFAQLSFPFSWR